MSIYYLSFNPEVANSSPENQEFWTAVEENFVQTNLQLSDADFEYRVPLLTLKGFFHACVNLNKPGMCHFGTNTGSPFLMLLKRHFMRNSNVAKEEFKHYIFLIQALVMSKHLRTIIDD